MLSPLAVGVVDEAVEDGVGGGGASDDLMPMLDRQLTGDDGRSALVAIVDDFEEITTLVAGERGETPVVEDEQVDPRQHLEEPCVASVFARERQSFEQPWQPVVEDGTVVSACLVAERAGDPTLADAGRPGDEQVLLATDPIAIDELGEEGAIDAQESARIVNTARPSLRRLTLRTTRFTSAGVPPSAP
jgi:hypothetical protein